MSQPIVDMTDFDETKIGKKIKSLVYCFNVIANLPDDSVDTVLFDGKKLHEKITGDTTPVTLNPDEEKYHTAQAAIIRKEQTLSE